MHKGTSQGQKSTRKDLGPDCEVDAIEAGGGVAKMTRAVKEDRHHPPWPVSVHSRLR